MNPFYILWRNLVQEDDKVCLTLEECDDEMVLLWNNYTNTKTDPGKVVENGWKWWKMDENWWKWMRIAESRCLTLKDRDDEMVKLWGNIGIWYESKPSRAFTFQKFGWSTKWSYAISISIEIYQSSSNLTIVETNQMQNQTKTNQTKKPFFQSSLSLSS